jgi:xanthine dehydrogenase large subunit
MINADTRLHVRGESQYVDDQPVPEDTLFAAVCPSPVAHGEIRGLDVSAAASRPGVEAVIRPADIPGENQIGNIIQDEPLLADGEVRYLGQPLAIVVARSADLARAAAQTIKPEIVERPAVFDPREAHRKGDLITPARTFVLGDVHGAWSACRWVVEGRADSGGQEHAYLESQGAVAVPAEGGRVKLISATQSPSVVQRIVARVLGVPMQAVEVDVLRLGGAFGGKEDQATAWAAVAAVAARVTGKPVKIVLRRREDILMTGKRHPYSSDFRIGLSADLKILAYEVMFYQDAGAAADLSPSILERTLFHATNSYCVPNVKATAASCRTHRAPNTAFRGFGAPQAMYAMECAIFKAAEVIGVAPEEIQRRNLLQEGDVFPYGMRCETTSVARSWERIERQPEVVTAARRVEAFNREHIWEKKGLARMPVCFGISFTSTPLNQAGALVHVYSDGSVGISTAAVEMGQGVNTKIRQVAAQAFGISVERVRMESTNTTRVANMPPTAASAAADMNGEAALRACAAILDRLKDVACGQLGGAAAEDIRMGETVFVRDEATPLTWEEVIRAAHRSRVDLSAHAHYATPGLSFD